MRITAPNPNRVIRDKEFAKRFETSCDKLSKIPDWNHGRLSYIKKQLSDRFNIDVEVQTVSRWAIGEARPRRDKIGHLAQILEVNPVWLETGIEPGLPAREQRRFTMGAAGAASVAIGLAQLDGLAIAFPGAADPRKDTVTFYTIINGTQHSVHATAAKPEGDHSLSFLVPREHEGLTVVGVVRRAGAVDLVLLSPEAISKGKKSGDYFEVAANMRGSDFVSERRTLKKIVDFSADLGN